MIFRRQRKKVMGSGYWKVR